MVFSFSNGFSFWVFGLRFRYLLGAWDEENRDCRSRVHRKGGPGTYIENSWMMQGTVGITVVL
jgi:hypothetical protein